MSNPLDKVETNKSNTKGCLNMNNKPQVKQKRKIIDILNEKDELKFPKVPLELNEVAIHSRCRRNIKNLISNLRPKESIECGIMGKEVCIA
jgi:hypothetical protein